MIKLFNHCHFCVNAELQTSHRKGRWPRWYVRWWFTRVVWCQNVLVQFIHLNGGSPPACLIWCCPRWHCCLNLLEQFVHWNGNAPVWVRLCTARWCFLKKLFPHFRHECFLIGCVFFLIITCFDVLFFAMGSGNDDIVFIVSLLKGSSTRTIKRHVNKILTLLP